MRVAIRHIHSNLLWSVTGTVWAVWRIEPIGSRYASPLERQEAHARVTSLIRSLSGSARLYSLCARIEPWEVAERMVQGVDVVANPGAAEIAEVSKAMMAGTEMHRRTLWLAIPLQAPGRSAQWSQARGGMWSMFEEQAGLPAAPVPEAEVALYEGLARQLESGFGGGLRIRAARPAEIVWMHQHAVHRGMAGPLLADAEVSRQRGGRLVGAQLRSPGYASLGQVRLLEGGNAGERDRGRRPGEGVWDSVRRWFASRFDGTALSRVWLEVETEDGVGYQAHMGLEEIPEAVHESRADILAQLERLEFPVDVVIDLTIVDSARARRQIAKKKRELVDQADQWAAHPAGAPDSIYGAAETLGEQEARLGSSVEREVQSRTVLTVWGATAQECDERARTFKARLSGANYAVIRPRGGQLRLFSLGLPGAAAARRARECTQFQLSEDFALSGPLTSGEIGDSTGTMIAQSLDVGTTRPVLLDLADAPLRDAAASLAVIGDLGSGKSVVLKRLTADIIDRGHRAIVIDRTTQREWAAFARTAAPGRAQIIDAAQAEVSIDPLRVLPPAQGEAAAISYLTLQLCLEPMSAQGAAVSRAVKAAASSPRPHMGLVLEELEEIAREGGARGDAAAEVLDLLHTVSDRPLAAMLFDPALPALDLSDLSADLVVFSTSGLTLPPREALARPEVLRAQPLEALIGRAVLYLVAAISRQVAFADRSRFSPVVVDECYWLTSSAEGHALVAELAHDGRKHWAGLMLGGHDELDLGDATIQGLIRYRLLARTGDDAMARRGLNFLGLPTDDDGLVELVTGLSPAGNRDRVGEMLLRDGQGRIGLIQVIVPRVDRYAKIFTTPGGAGGAPAKRGRVRQTAGVR
ncbi:ATP-binding protein [Kitasatospora aureofaciens]|uniref:ATP-binding protein n=1 Tax=Kitasatospora aureofaciens TaxID=1894 RepID=UPI003408F94F